LSPRLANGWSKVSRGLTLLYPQLASVIRKINHGPKAWRAGAYSSEMTAYCKGASFRHEDSAIAERTMHGH
jgi:hypothetical protein